MSEALLITGNYHLGDNPGVFQDATYVGHTIALPVHKTWVNPNADSVSFVIYAGAVETWGQWDGHAVDINGTTIGRIKDAGNTTVGEERFEIVIPKSRFEELLAGKDNFILGVQLDTQEAHPGFADDFIIKRFSIIGFAGKVGWK